MGKFEVKRWMDTQEKDSSALTVYIVLDKIKKHNVENTITFQNSIFMTPRCIHAKKQGQIYKEMDAQESTLAGKSSVWLYLKPRLYVLLSLGLEGL